MPGIDVWLSALHGSHDRLVEVAGGLSAQQVSGPSYASEWSIAQVLSHLGSGAEIFSLFLQAGAQGQPAPAVEDFQPIWKGWDAKAPADQASDSLKADAEFLGQLDALTPQQREQWSLSLFGASQGLADLLRLRLGEHAVHVWDIAVMQDERATLAAGVVALLIDGIGQLVARAGKPTLEALRVAVITEQPTRQFVLVADNAHVALEADQTANSAGDEGRLRLPAEALIRLIYGRLDARHTPEVAAEAVDLDALRQLFPGF